MGCWEGSWGLGVGFGGTCASKSPPPCVKACTVLPHAGTCHEGLSPSTRGILCVVCQDKCGQELAANCSMFWGRTSLSELISMQSAIRHQYWCIGVQQGAQKQAVCSIGVAISP